MRKKRVAERCDRIMKYYDGLGLLKVKKFTFQEISLHLRNGKKRICQNFRSAE